MSTRTPPTLQLRATAASLPLSTVCGQLLVVGFQGTTLPPSLARSLAAGERGGVIHFARNVAMLGDGAEKLVDVAAVAALNAQIAAAANDCAPPLVAVDQEGGRVARLRAPLLAVPPMRTVAETGDEARAERIAEAQARELAALGFTMSFAPVLDVNVCAENPVIGDRAFSDDAATVARYGVAWARGLRRGGVLACGKHFPGHGDTVLDSHLDLPVVDVPRARLDAVEIPPFAAAARAGIDAMMSAHVVYPALSDKPATLSREICTDLLRGELRFDGVLFSDDLEMRAIADRYGLEDAAVAAIAAGCDALLVCSQPELAERAHVALLREAERSAVFRERAIEACHRNLRMRAGMAPRPLTDRDALAQALAKTEIA